MKKAEIWIINLDTNTGSPHGELVLEGGRLMPVPAGAGQEQERNRQNLEEILQRSFFRPGVDYQAPEEEWPPNWKVSSHTDPLLWLQLLAESSRRSTALDVRLVGIPYLGQYTPPEDTPRAANP